MAKPEEKEIGCIPLERMNSVLTAANCYNLASCVDEGNLRLFRDLLEDVDPSELNDNIVQRDHATLLHVIAKSGKAEFFRELVKKHGRRVNPNQPHQVLQKFPIHAAAEEGHFEMVQLLLQFGADVNARAEDGTTALHLLAMRSGANWAQSLDQARLKQHFFLAAKTVLGWPGVNVDCKNNIGVVPLYFAVDTGSYEVAELLLDSGACITVEVDEEPLEEFIKEKMPKLLLERSLEKNRTNRDTKENELFQLLYDELYRPGRFVPQWEEVERKHGKVDAEANNGSYTFLQYCCDQGHNSLVSFLLEKGANPNGFCSNYPVPPLVIAGHHGYHKILTTFKDWTLSKGTTSPADFCSVDSVKKENVLHKILKQESKSHANVGHRDYDRCLDVLLDDDRRFSRLMVETINAQDHLGNSPLHLAAQLGNTTAVRQLLRKGANIGLKNYRCETPIAHIPPTVMSDFLDECLESEGLASDDQFMITFKYSFLGPPVCHKRDPLLEDGQEPECRGGQPKHDLPEAEPLWYMAQLPRHKQLLLHPVITSFLCLKWRRIRPYYYVNLACYLLFVASLTAFLILGNIDPEGTSGRRSKASLVLLHFTGVLLTILAIREGFQALISFRRYIFNVENVLEVCLIISSFYLISGESPSASVAHRSLSAAAILLSWAEMVLLLGRHPRLSTFITMLSRVSRNFALFLTWYVPIIVAFGLAFFIVLHRPVGDEGNDHFASPEQSLLKTIVMSLAGELEYEGIDFDSAFSKIIFVLFIFFVMLVLVNLLNGLAVSDIAEIKKEAEIVSLVSRVEIIAFIESMLLGDPFQFMTNFPSTSWARKLPSCDCLQTVYRSRVVRKALNFVVGPTLLFNERLSGKKAVFYPNQSAKERSLPGPDGKPSSKKTALQVDGEILDSAKALVVKRQETDQMSELQARLKQLEKGLFLITKQQNHIIEKLNG